MSSMDFLPFAVAEELGVFDSLGLDVEIVKFFSANDRDAALQAGRIDATVTDYTSAAIQIAGGVEASLVMKLDGYFIWLSRLDPATGLPVLLENSRFAVSSNTVIDFLTDSLTAPLRSDNQPIRRVEVNKIPLRLQMLQQGEIDATILPEPFISMALAAGGCYPISDTRLLDIQATGLLVASRLIQADEEAVRLLMLGYNVAVERLRETPRAQINDWLTAHAGAPKEIAPKIDLPEYTAAATPRPRDVEAAIGWLKRKGVLTKELRSEQIINDKLIPPSKPKAE